ncbi:MAG: U32 family peptidase [Clostridia bacterium]|nr:U32 family peptidase [Clostridia bacterium]MBQ7897769.1 U32 family peptidase [Clostridia bacterium]
MKKTEILSPAGNFEKLTFAAGYGADAVYFAGTSFGMRAAAGNFSTDEIKKGADYLHTLHKKAYLTLNTMPRSDEMPLLDAYLEELSDTGIDAVIVADLGVFEAVKKRLPKVDIHISTQGANMNYASCRVWHEMGAKRVVLARELSLDDIATIRAKTPAELELEAFVHGAMCVSVSGRCLLSEYYLGRDANRGACAQPCRWIYNFAEEKRPEDVLTAEMHPEGTYIFGSKDMNLVSHIPELVKAGIDSLKIEGRMKSAYYTAVVTNAYRIALDNHFGENSGITSDALERELDSVSHREYCTGYYFTHPQSENNLATIPGYIKEKSFLATVEDYNEETGLALCRQRNKMFLENEAEIISPGKTGVSFKALGMTDEKGTPIESTPHAGMLFYLKMPFAVKKGDIIRGK